jgi:hypothetical protein
MPPLQESADDAFDDEFEEDPEGPQESDLAGQDDDEMATVPCPCCGEPIPEIADRCPYCGDWVVAGGARGRPARGAAFAVVVALAVLVLLYLLLAR